MTNDDRITRSLLFDIIRPSGASISNIEEKIVKVLSDHQSILILLKLVSERASTYKNIARKMVHIPTSRKLVALMDFDVIYNYITAESGNRRRQLEVRHFFERSEIPYYIPIGAFHELVNYLRRFKEFRLPIPPDQEPDYAEIARITFKLNEMQQRKPFITPEDQRFGQSYLSISRLNKLLDSPKRHRYKGVVSNRSKDLENVFLQLLEEETRIDIDPISAVEMKRAIEARKNDAANLACAATMSKMVSSSHFAVLSNTRAVHGAASSFFRTGFSDGTLCSLTPEDMVWLDLCDFHTKRNFARSTLVNVSQKMESLELLLVNLHENLTSGEGVCFSEEDRFQLSSKIRDIAEDETTSTISLETDRAAFQAADYHHRRYLYEQDQDEETPSDQINPRDSYLSFLRCISVVSRALGDRGPQQYRYNQLEGVRDSGQIFLLIDESSVTGETIASIQFYNRAKDRWTLNFICDGELSSFVSILATSNVIRLDDRVDKKGYRSISITDTLPRKGIFVSYSHGSVAIESDAIDNGPIDGSSLLSMSKLILLGLKQFKLWGGNSLRSNKIFPEILSLRVVNQSVDVSFELIPPENRYDRHVTIHGAGFIEDWVLDLIQGLGKSLINKKKLREVVDQLIKTDLESDDATSTKK
jgi:hypothetical protein